MDSITLLKELIKVDSSSKKNANKLIDYVSDYLYAKGLEGEIIENNGYKSYILTIGKGSKTIVLNGHLDVVPGKEYQFNPIEKNGRIYGRGSADMKSGCVAMINTVVELSKKKLPNRVMLQLVTDEESGGFNCTKYLVDNGYIGDFVICTEPTNLDVSIQAKGFLRLDLEVHGLAAHGSRPWQGDNAIVKAIEDYNEIKNLPILQIGSDFYESSTVTLSLIKGGDVYNKVPDKAKIGLDIRYIPSLNQDDIMYQIKDVTEGNVKLKSSGNSINTEAENPHVKNLLEVIGLINKDMEVKIFGQHGSSDARFFSNKGIPVVEFGPMGCDWHGDDEYMEIESLYKLEKILKNFIKNFK